MTSKASSIFRSAAWVMFVVSVVTIISGCNRGRPSEKPPIHLNPNMDIQEKVTVQSANPFFEDNSAMRKPVAGTISRGNLREDTVYYEGKNENGEFVQGLPVKVNYKLLQRGQERFNIYCAVCHGQTGEGNGIVTQRGLLPPPTYHDDRMREKADGYIFDVITNGTGNMKSYKHQVSVSDRWAIVAYVRALQRSQHAGYDDLPEVEKTELK